MFIQVAYPETIDTGCFMGTETQENLKRAILAELPRLMESDPDVRDFILRITRERFADKEETESRFDRIMFELQRDREIQEKKWEAQEKKWEEQTKRWLAWEKKWEEERKAEEKKWEKQDKKWEKQDKKWEEQTKRWEAWEKKWEENQQVIKGILNSIKKLEQKHEASIGGLGARWGLQSESAFRNGLKAILEESFAVQVERYEDYDHEGVVFGRPEQIELDVIIFNGILILCEIKSSISKSDLYAFWRKKNFYEDKHGRKASRTMIISPMIDPRCRKAAEELGIELYSHSLDVKL